MISPNDVGQEIHSETSSGFDTLLGKAQRLKEILNLARSGNKITAIKIYRETFGVGLAEAKDAVERLERGESINFQNVNFQSYEPIKFNNQAVVKTAKVVGGSALLMVFSIIGVTLVFIGGIIWFVSSKVTSTISNINLPGNSQKDKKALFASETFRFGGEGTGAGYFEDNRAIAIDGDGRIYSGDYHGGRIQQFDASGKFLSQWQIGEDAYLQKIAADRKNRVYILDTRRLNIFDGAGGQKIGTVENPNYRDITVSSDGKLYALTNNNELATLDDKGKITSKSGDLTRQFNFKSGNLLNLAVEASGNFYVFENQNNYTLKFSPDAKFQFRFDGIPGKEKQKIDVRDLAIDSKGRVFVTDVSEIYVFNGDGRYVDSFPVKQTFGIAFDDKGGLWTASRPFVVKYEITK